MAETFAIAIFMLSFSNKCINIIHRDIRVIDSYSLYLINFSSLIF